MVGQLSADTAGAVGTGRRDVLVVVLTGVSGFVDGIGVVALGGAFTSVMTGNMVLTGIGVARGDTTLFTTTSSAIVAYLVGCLAGARLAGLPTPDQPVWPASTRRTLTVELLLLVVSGVGWWVFRPWQSGDDVRLPLLLCNAVALGMQSAAVNRFGVSGLSTTFLTGTLTNIAVSLATGRPLAAVRRPIVQLVVLILGGALGALLALHGRAFVPVFPILGLLVVLLASGARRRAKVGSLD